MNQKADLQGNTMEGGGVWGKQEIEGSKGSGKSTKGLEWGKKIGFQGNSDKSSK